jgi:serine/threonine protein phosphatase 1
MQDVLSLVRGARLREELGWIRGRRLGKRTELVPVLVELAVAGDQVRSTHHEEEETSEYQRASSKTVPMSPAGRRHAGDCAHLQGRVNRPRFDGPLRGRHVGGEMPGRLFVVGDIHGCCRELDVLLRGLDVAAGETVVFLGDYVDRGPRVRGVIERLIALAADPAVTTVFLRGNHEDMLLGYLGRDGHYGEAFLANGGDVTVRSYGVLGTPSASRFETALPSAHLDFLLATKLMHVEGDYLMVHAGVRPDRPLGRQNPHDLLWIRDEFIARPHGFGKIVVFGHTPMRAVLNDFPYKIGIDTGCVYGGMLTALEVPQLTVHAVRHGANSVERRGLLA